MLRIVCLTSMLFAVPLSALAADMKYTEIEEPKFAEEGVDQEESLIDWTSLDIDSTMRSPDERGWSWSVAISERLDLLCDVRPHEPAEPEVFTFGGLAFSR